MTSEADRAEKCLDIVQQVGVAHLYAIPVLLYFIFITPSLLFAFFCFLSFDLPFSVSFATSVSYMIFPTVLLLRISCSIFFLKILCPLSFFPFFYFLILFFFLFFLSIFSLVESPRSLSL